MQVNSKVSNTTALAYLGDAVYEVYVRRFVLEHGNPRVDQMNKVAIRFVCADGQALAARKLIASEFLTEEEVRLLKRARNHTQTSKPRGTKPIDYKMATGLEALIGYLYLGGEIQRMEEVIAEAMRVIEEEASDSKGTSKKENRQASAESQDE